MEKILTANANDSQLHEDHRRTKKSAAVAALEVR